MMAGHLQHYDTSLSATIRLSQFEAPKYDDMFLMCILLIDQSICIVMQGDSLLPVDENEMH